VDQHKRRGRALTVSTAAAVAAVLATTGLAWGADGVSRSAGVSRQVATPEATGEAFIGVEPVRVLDTRPPDNGPIGVPAAGALLGGQQINLPVTTAAPNAKSAPLPANATSVLLNVTIDGDATEKSFLTVWPEGTPRPFASANNAEPGLVSPNLTFVKLGPTGGVSFFAQAGAVNLAVDLVGYTVPVGDAPGSGLLLTGSGAPTDDRGSDGAFYLDADTGLLYGPKADGTWPGPSPVPTESSPDAVSQGIDDSALTMVDDGTPAFDFGPPVTVWTITGLTTAGDYELDASVEVRPSGIFTVDGTVQCWWSSRPDRRFATTLPFSLASADQNEVTGTVSVAGSMAGATTADLICRTGSLADLGGPVEIQSVQVSAHRVNLLDNS
jgi:hypothetical protein